jgi:hypothetical protein
MSATSQLTGLFRDPLEHPTRGVIGLVNDLLRLCQEQGLQLDWQADRCRVRSLAGGAEEVIDRPLRKSAFRAILARVAALCSERSPDTISPYGGQGELTVGLDPATVFRVAFTNTLDEQRLELTPVRIGGNARGEHNAEPAPPAC